MLLYIGQIILIANYFVEFHIILKVKNNEILKPDHFGQALTLLNSTNK